MLVFTTVVSFSLQGAGIQAIRQPCSGQAVAACSGFNLADPHARARKPNQPRGGAEDASPERANTCCESHHLTRRRQAR
jgi:hypothetical protein